MAKKEIYRLDIKIDVDGDSEAQKKLTATERFAKQSEKKMKALDKIKASPSVRLKDKLSKPLKKVEGRLSSFSKRACSKLTAVVTAGALMMGGLGASAAVRDFSNFEQGLANVKAISGATAQEMQVLSKEAKRLGAATAWSAKDVTDAETLLSQAGFSVKETVSALPGLLDLASAGELDLAQATDITAGTLRAFGIEASKSAHVADVLALTASRTNSDVSGLGESLKYVAPVSKSLGISMEETSAAIGLLANANIKGSQAGTVLRASLARLANPSKQASETIEKLGFSAFDSKGKMLPLSQVVGNLKKSMSGLTKQQQAQAISTIFGTEAMSGMMALVEQGPEKLSNLTQELEKSDGSAKKMAETRLDSLQGQFTILKSAVEGMNIELGERLAPYAKEFVTWFTAKIPDITQGIIKVVDTISNLAKKFNSLSSGTKKMFAAVAIGIVAFNPLSKAIRGTNKALSFLVGLSPKLFTFLGITKKATVAAQATKTLATGTGLAAKGFGGLGLAAKGGALLFNPWVLGIGAATYGGIKLYKHLKKDSIPAVKEFGEEVSKTTADAMNAYMKLDKHVGQSLMDIKINNKKITKEIAQDVTGDFNKMSEQVKGAIDKKYNESYQTMQKFMSKGSGLREEENQQVLNKIKEKQELEKNAIQQGQNRINEIFSLASQDRRQISLDEWNEINTIRDNMTQSAVENISKSAQEQRVILEKLKFDSSNLTAEQAAQVVQNSVKARDGSIQAAEEQYNETLAEIIHQRDDLGTITDEQASKMIEVAQQQKEETVLKARAMHTEVVEHAQQQAGEHAAQVEWETGKVKSNFDTMMDKIREFNELSIKEKVITITQKINSIFKKQNEENGTPFELQDGKAHGSNNVSPGFHEVAERGFEIVVGKQTRLFNGGERVLNNRESKKFLQNGFEKQNNETHEKEPSPYFAVAQPQLAGSGGNSIKVDVDMENNFSNDEDVETIVQEAMQEFGHKLKEALKNTKK